MVEKKGTSSEQHQQQFKAKNQFAGKEQQQHKQAGRYELVLDIKPNDVNQDLNALEKKIKNCKKEGLNWGISSIEEIAYGANKLRLMCVFDSDKLSQSEIEEMIGGLDGVQDTDIVGCNKV